MITSTQAAQFVTKIHDPIDYEEFDKVIEVRSILVGIKTLDNVTVFAFPGAENKHDYLDCMKSVLGLSYQNNIGIVVNSFYSGMYQLIERILPELKQAKSIAITGHSLGATRAIYLALYCINTGIKVASVELFAPPLSTSKTAIRQLSDRISRVRAFINGNDPIPSLPAYPQLAQLPLIKLKQSPGIFNRWFAIEWHFMKWYALAVSNAQL